MSVPDDVKSGGLRKVDAILAIPEDIYLQAKMMMYENRQQFDAAEIARLRHDLWEERERSRVLKLKLADAQAQVRYLDDPTDEKRKRVKAQRLVREEKVYQLRQSGMTFVAIAKRLRITPAKASEMYRRADFRHQPDAVQDVL